MPTEKLLLIDAYSQIFRAYHAIHELSTSGGLPTNAVYGFTTMLRRSLQQENPEYCAAVFDPPGPTVRHEAYEDYKKSRPETPPDLLVQVPYIKRVCGALGIALLEVPLYEADDVISTVAKRADAEGVETLILSEDKDLLQLVGGQIRVLAERGRRRVYDEAEVVRKLGVPPNLVPDLLGLMGDSVDDIPGVPGIGPKRATELLQRYGSVDAAIENAADLAKYKYGRNLAEHADMARLSKELATVHTDVDVAFDRDVLRVREPDSPACREVFSELQFRRLTEEFSEEPAPSDGDYRTVVDADDLRAVIEEIRTAGRLSLDLETTHQEPTRARIVGFALSWKPESGVYVPVAHQGLGAENAMGTEEALDLLRPVVNDPAIEIVGQNIKYDLVVLARHGAADVPVDFDSMVASYVLHPTRQSHGLDALALDFLGMRTVKFGDVLPDKESTFADVPVPEATRYAAEDADVALRLVTLFEADLESQELMPLFRDLEMPLIPVLAAMELRGVRLDTGYLAELGERTRSDLDRLQATVFEAAGGEFNLNSPKQMAEVLFDRLELPSHGRTAKTGSRSTRAEVLEALAVEHPIAARILEYRELAKLQSTYIESLPTLVNPETGRVHTSFNQTVTATGRLSSSNPNLQNIPIRKPLGRQIRRAFVPAEGHVLVSADYSQIELRIMAHLSGDSGLRAAFAAGKDIHRATAAEVFGVAPPEVTTEQRNRAKVINFGILYGMGPQRLAREFGIGMQEAKDFIERYFRAYAGIKEYLERTIERARAKGYVTTLLGRVRHLPELASERPMVRSTGERVAVNTPIQGTAADLIKRAMVSLHHRLEDRGTNAGMIIQVHDELVLEVPEDDVEATSAIVREEMESALELDVPLVVDLASGPNWMDAKP